MTGTTPGGFDELGINSDDFIDNAETDFGREVTHYVQTGTTDFRGNTTRSFDGGTTRTVVLHERSKTRVRGKEGMINLAPAYMMHRTTYGIGTGDRVELDGKRWKVFNVINRKGIFNYSDLYLEKK